MSFLIGNPLSTPVGQRIDQATDGSLASENWGLNMEICDIINETEEGPRDAIKALRKKLSTSGRNYKSIMYSLTVLETCVKNCRRFHAFVATKDFMQELIKIIGPKNDPPQVVQEKVLSLIQTWADAFRGVPELKEVEKVYRDLKSKGIEFPMTDLDSLAPIHTPARSTPEVDPAMSPTRVPSARAPQPPVVPQARVRPVPAPQYVSSGPINVTPEQLAKLRSELDIVQGNCRVFGEMLTEMVPGQEDPSDLELLQELNRTCRQMQQRVVELLDKVANEEVTGELLRINDDLNNVFLRYDRFERYRSGQTVGSTPSAEQIPEQIPASMLPPSYEVAAGGMPAQPSPAAQSVSQPPTANLIDLGDESSTTANDDIHLRLAGMSVTGGSVSNTLGQLNSTPSTNAPGDDFDMFAQSRQSFDQNKQTVGGTSSTYANQQSDQYQGGLGAAVNAKNTGNPSYGKKGEEEIEELPDGVNDMEEMEKWLQQNKQASGAGQETMTSSEFDKFLSERVTESEQLPDITAQNTVPLQQGLRTNPRGGRQLQKDDTENALFAL